MNKQEFLYELRLGLNGLPKDDVEERINFYSEIIDDRIEEGLAEEDAVSGLGSVKSIVSQIMSEIPLSKLVTERVKPNRALRAWEIVLLILGSPIWLSLLVAFVAVIFAIYVVILSVIVSLFAIVASFGACAIGGVFAFFVCMFTGSYLSGIALLGAGLVSAGLGIFLFFGSKGATKEILKLTKWIFIWIKSWFIKKEAAK